MKVLGACIAALSLPCGGLGAFIGIIDPRHGSEVFGYALMVLSVLGVAFGAWLMFSPNATKH